MSSSPPHDAHKEKTMGSWHSPGPPAAASDTGWAYLSREHLSKLITSGQRGVPWGRGEQGRHQGSVCSTAVGGAADHRSGGRHLRSPCMGALRARCHLQRWSQYMANKSVGGTVSRPAQHSSHCAGSHMMLDKYQPVVRKHAGDNMSPTELNHTADPTPLGGSSVTQSHSQAQPGVRPQGLLI